MGAVKEYKYPDYDFYNRRLIELIANTAGDDIAESNRERGENCHITEDWDPMFLYDHQEVGDFVNWLEETTEKKLLNIWGVLYYDNGGIKWHSHHSEKDVTHSFVYYVNVPPNSSSIFFSRDPSNGSSAVSIDPQAGHCLVWESDLPHCVPPSNHSGRCVISGNLK